ncbi:hypothetical protein BH11ACT3_BH11ACT3_17180 [soil metagenome]
MHLGRLTALRTAALLAVGFVVLRVIYRVVFGGGSGTGTLLLDLPRVRLAGPFSHVTLFGPISTGGLWSAALSALPFAAVVLAFGLLSVLVDLRALLARGALRGPVRTVSRALIVAWATFPALRDSVRRVLVARELRGERSAAALLVPVLEHTVERALALGASMEVRGFAASSRRPEPVCERPVTMVDAAVGFEDRWVLKGVDLHLAPGSLTLVTGPTGSGKSTLLDALSGLFQHFEEGEQTGLIEVAGADRATTPPRDTAGFVGVVAQSVRMSFVSATVADELGFALSVRGVAPVIVRARATEVAGNLGITHLLDRSIDALSAGEACLVAIGAALISNPVVLIVDEPLADLDTEARARVVDILDRLAHEAGVCVVVAEHAIEAWGDLPDLRLELRDGAVHRVNRPTRSPAQRHPHRSSARGKQLLRVRHLSVEHDGQTAVDDVSFDLITGEVVALRGPNGAGKSSLLHALARPTERGVVTVGDLDVAGLRPRARRSAVALVPESSDDLLFATTVAGECRRSGVATADIFAGFLGFDAARDPDAIWGRHPRDLSVGQRLCLAIAIQLSARPDVLLVDEPTRGLDAAAQHIVGHALERAAASGAAVVVATHDRDFAERFTTRTISMTAGRIVDATVTS